MRQRLTIAALLLLLLPAAAGAATPPPLPQSEADRKAFAEDVCSEIDVRATQYALPQSFIARLIWKESLFDPGAVSPKGAQGIAQFMPEVWKQYGVDGNRDGVVDVWDPVDAIHSAAELNCLNRRLVRSASGNRLSNTLAAYNSGYGAVLKYDGVPPFPETQAYVAKILESAKTIVVRP